MTKFNARKFEKDLQKAVTDQINNSLRSRTFDKKCPHCNASVKLSVGKNICPTCRREIDLTFDFK